MHDIKKKSRGASTDMSSAEILRRLEILSDLYRLATTLARARRIDDPVKSSNKRR